MPNGRLLSIIIGSLLAIFPESYFEKRTMRGGLLFVIVIGLLLICPAGLWADEKPPIILDVIFDQRSVEEIGERMMKKHFFETVKKASDVFYKEIGRGLVVGKVFIESPPQVSASLKSVLVIPTLFWMSKRWGSSEDNRRLIFSTTRFLYEDVTKQFFEEWAPDRFIFIKIFTYDPQRNVANLLHGLGHTCGAIHSADPNSFMNLAVYETDSFGDMTDVIKNKCGA